jgi:hypothetical protein
MKKLADVFVGVVTSTKDTASLKSLYFEKNSDEFRNNQTGLTTASCLDQLWGISSALAGWLWDKRGIEGNVFGLESDRSQAVYKMKEMANST